MCVSFISSMRRILPKLQLSTQKEPDTAIIMDTWPVSEITIFVANAARIGLLRPDIAIGVTHIYSRLSVLGKNSANNRGKPISAFINSLQGHIEIVEKFIEDELDSVIDNSLVPYLTDHGVDTTIGNEPP